MAPFRGGGRGRGRGRGGRGSRGNRGGSRGGVTGKPARSGMRTKTGYKKFDSQRTIDVDDQPDLPPEEESEEEDDFDDDDDENEDSETEDVETTGKAYSALIHSFRQQAGPEERRAKRRKIQEEVAQPEEYHENQEAEEALAEDGASDMDEQQDEALGDDGDLDSDRERDPFETHFARPDDNELSRRLKAIQANDLKIERTSIGRNANITVSAPSCIKHSVLHKSQIKGIQELHLKERIRKNVQESESALLPSELERTVASHMFNYEDVLLGNRTPRNAQALRRLACLHAVNHILKGRDKVIKNNERSNLADTIVDLDLRDQGFVRPKVLILLETRQMAANYADAIVEAFQPDQQENRKRFDDSFSDPIDDRENVPEDYRELFGGNNDNRFLSALKFTRKTLKFYSAFYNSDVILASPLGLRRIIENEDAKKRDHDFLSSIEVLIVDQANAMEMQSWENVQVVFKHLNQDLKEAHGCDFSRVRNWYLDGNAKYLRQTIVISTYLTPEVNSLYNNNMLNVAGKAKILPDYTGAITETSGLGFKQTFSRFDSPSPLNDPDARFRYFTTAVLPGLLRLPKAADGTQGVLIFIPSYFDFLRLRNFFATSVQTENIPFGTIHDYSEVSDQRRARSHFLSGKHSILLYTQRAHHFFRLRLRGAKRVVMYGLPDNPIFYKELVEGYLGTSASEGRIDPVEASVRNLFSKWDGMRLERVVGSRRVKGMLGGVGDTFDFV